MNVIDVANELDISEYQVFINAYQDYHGLNKLDIEHEVVIAEDFDTYLARQPDYLVIPPYINYYCRKIEEGKWRKEF